jgi:hypothetical protein
MIGVHHHPGLLVEGWDFFFFLLRLALNYHPPKRHLLSSWLNNASTLWEMIHGCPWEHCFDELGDYST